jgi:hypothetical protein
MVKWGGVMLVALAVIFSLTMTVVYLFIAAIQFAAQFLISTSVQLSGAKRSRREAHSSPAKQSGQS